MSKSKELITINNLNIFNELSELIMLRINACSEISHPQDWIENKNHLDYDLWCIKEGKIEIHIHDKVFLASKGDLILFSPNMTYTAKSVDSGCSFIFTHFDFGLGEHLGIIDNFQIAGVISRTLVKEEINMFLDTYDQYKHMSPMSGIRLKGCLTILIAKILEDYGLGQYRGDFTSHDGLKGKQSIKLDTLQPVFMYIQEHLHQSLRVKDLPTLVGMSEKYFISYFKQALGVTPGRYIYQLRMNRARELLYDKRYSIQQISGMLGYPDQYSFSKAFKKYYKVSPSQFVW